MFTTNGLATEIWREQKREDEEHSANGPQVLSGYP